MFPEMILGEASTVAWQLIPNEGKATMFVASAKVLNSSSHLHAINDFDAVHGSVLSRDNMIHSQAA